MASVDAIEHKKQPRIKEQLSKQNEFARSYAWCMQFRESPHVPSGLKKGIDVCTLWTDARLHFTEQSHDKEAWS